MPKKVCFVISPIGDPETEIRRNADALLELVIEPALQKYDFQVVRADRIPRPAIITADIVELVQNADLCIIELTGKNPNVYYECGRRHETRKPFIQLIRRDEEAGSTIAGTATVVYDHTTPYATLASVRALQKAVDEFEGSGYANSSSGVSLSTISALIDRIEKRVVQLSEPKLLSVGRKRATVSSSLSDVFKPPRERFFDAVSAGDVEGAAAVLPRLRETDAFVTAAGLVARAGHQAGAEELIRYLDQRMDTIDYEAFQLCTASIVNYYNGTEGVQEGYPIVRRLVDQFVAKHHGLTPKEEAFLLNQVQIMMHGAEEFDAALKGALRVIELVPDNAAYKYNASILYENLEQIPEAENMVDQYMALPGERSAGQLAHAATIYLKVDRIDDARRAFDRLTAVDRGRAALLLRDDDIKFKLAR